MTTQTFKNYDGYLLAETLAKLINRDKKLTPSVLARRLNIPVNKITRILNGDVTDPKASTLLQIANSFDISINQLLGLEPLICNENENLNIATKIPIYKLTQFDQKQRVTSWYNWIENNVAEHFALIVDTDLYTPTIPEKAILIINPELIAEDRSYILVNKKSQPDNLMIKKLVHNVGEQYLYPIDTRLPIEIYDKDVYNTAGVILELHQKMNLK